MASGTYCAVFSTRQMDVRNETARDVLFRIYFMVGKPTFDQVVEAGLAAAIDLQEAIAEGFLGFGFADDGETKKRCGKGR